MMIPRKRYSLTGLLAIVVMVGTLACAPSQKGQEIEEPRPTNSAPEVTAPPQEDTQEKANMEEAFALAQGVSMQLKNSKLEAMPATVNYMSGSIQPDPNVTLYFSNIESQARVQYIPNSESVTKIGELQPSDRSDQQVYRSQVEDTSGEYTRYLITGLGEGAPGVLVDILVFPVPGLSDTEDIPVPRLQDFFEFTFSDDVQVGDTFTHHVSAVDYSSSPYNNPIYYKPQDWSESVSSTDPTETTLTSADGNQSITFYYNAGTIAQGIFDNTEQGSFSAAGYIIVPVSDSGSTTFIGAAGDGDTVESAFKLSSKNAIDGLSVENLIESLYGAF